MVHKLYEKYHSKSKDQHKLISDNNFTYINILPPLNAALNKKVKDVLDIGCGSGTISLYLGSKGFNVTGIDISKKAIAACQESAKNLDQKTCKFYISNFPNKILPRKYDLVFFSEVIEHLPDDDLALKKIHRLLKPGGILFLSTPSKNAPLFRLGYSKKFDKEVGHLRRYDINELKTKLNRNGFEIKKTYKKEGILRNFLFLNSFAGKFIKFIKFFLVDIVTILDNLSCKILGESQLIIVAKKMS